MDDHQIAATLAAALIQCMGQGGVTKVKETPAELAAKTYFQCLDALAAEKKNRTTVTSTPRV
jgi:hypothetical protein